MFSGVVDFVVSGAGQSVRVPLSGFAGQVPEPDFIQGWIPRSAFKGVTDWSNLQPHIENGFQRLDLNMECFVEDPQTVQTGHVAGLTATGHLQGWCAKPESGDHELPVLATLGEARLFSFSRGRWATESFRSFSIPLGPLVRSGCVYPLHVAGCCTRANPFGRGDGFVMRTPVGLIHAAPVQLTHDTVQGAFQMVEDSDMVLTVTLRDGVHKSEIAACDQSGTYNFNGKTCSFVLPFSSSGVTPATSEIILGQVGVGDIGSFALADFMPDPNPTY